MLSLLLFLFIVSFNVVACFEFSAGSILGNRQVVFEKFDNFCRKRDLIIIFNQSGIRTEGDKMLVNCTITVKEDILKDPKLVVRMERCKNRESLDTCELFHNYRASSYCATTATFANGFIKSIEPEWKCPLKKGVYRATNAEIDALTFFVFPIESWYWKVLVTILDSDTDKILMCVMTEMHLKRMS